MRERTPFPRALLERLPNLRLLHATGTQHSTFDLVAARELGIIVATAPGRGRTDLSEEQRPHAKRDITKGGAHPTTQHAWALILALARNVAADDASVKSGGWQSSLAVGLTGKTLGICGLGRLGASTARVGVLAWGMKVVCWSENLTQEKADQRAREVGLPIEDEDGVKTFRLVSKGELFRLADVVSVHYVLGPRSLGVIGEKELGVMKPGAMIVNTSRGPLIDDDALFVALDEGRIRGAALDVFDIEPLPAKSRWRTTPWGKNGSGRVLLTPHMGYVEEEIMHTWYDETAENIERWMRGDEVLNRLN